MVNPSSDCAAARAISTPWSIPDVAHLGLLEIRNRSPLRIQVLPSGAMFAITYGETLINQVLPAPMDTGLFRLLVRCHDDRGICGSVSLVDAGVAVSVDRGQLAWTLDAASLGLTCRATLSLHPVAAAWRWHVRVTNATDVAKRVDVVLAQDLGLADAGAVRNNEAYTSHYIDLLPVPDDDWGWTILARQNQAMTEGRRPWFAATCLHGCAAYCTDGTQFFGEDHRLTGEPQAARASLPSQRLQYECALAGLQSHVRALSPGTTIETTFVARFLPDHPAASDRGDLARLREVLSGFGPGTHQTSKPAAPGPRSWFTAAPRCHGEPPTEEDWHAWFPGERRHEERGPDGVVHSFFRDADVHVVARAKEANVARPHGHILRSGSPTWIDPSQWGVTCFAAGIFAAQAYLGNPSFARLLPVVRNALHVSRGSGQRVFLRDGEAWAQLGIPSAFAMTPGEARWIYRLGEDVIEARVWCSPERTASFLELRVTAGAPREFLVTHEVVLGAVEYEHRGAITLFPDAGWASGVPAASSAVGQHQPGLCFAIAAAAPESLAALGGDELICTDGVRRDGPYVVLRFHAAAHCGVILTGSMTGVENLPAVVAAARAEFNGEARAAQPAPVPLRLTRGGDASVSRINDVLPWFHHNAAIHFSAPHGLEQTGGAAWGVRDVCQGSMEWLLATGQHASARRALEVVFAQQYAGDDTWPQWFMHPPYARHQSRHSHGDVCLWPVKALCDYVEASNDLAFLAAPIGFTDPEKFTSTGPVASVWAHCDRVITHVENRFLPGTALLNYGDGDWDDTLQPADPAMRTRMVSAWTVALACHTFRLLAEICRRAGEAERHERLRALLERMRSDFHDRLVVDGTVAGFLITEKEGSRLLLHPADRVTGIRYRLLPMTRAMLAELFTPDEARRHAALIEKHLRFADGVRLMSDPSPYAGGVERLFKRADTAANVGREIGLQYVHAHLRYAEAMAKLGDASALWTALQVVNPVGLSAVLPHAAPRQSNIYFSSSDADFADRHEAVTRWHELRAGRVAVRGGWRLYSSGPGLFLHKVRTCLLGLRESFDDVVFDPVLPQELDGLVAEIELDGRPVTIRYRVSRDGGAPLRIVVNEHTILIEHREPNPYRLGGARVSSAQLRARLRAAGNTVLVEC